MKIGLGLKVNPNFLIGIPTRTSSLWGWFDADHVTLDGNDRVERMNKIAGAGSDLVQSDSTKRPFYNADGGDNRPELLLDVETDQADRRMPIGLAGAAGQTHTLLAKQINGKGGVLFFWQAKRAAIQTRSGKLEYAENEAGNNENLGTYILH